jgi:hypothetical protein
MADTKLTDLTELDATPAIDDVLYIVDVSEGTAGSRKIESRYLWRTDGSAAYVSGGGTVALGGYVLTAPASGTMVTTAATQTLTNKSLTEPAIGTPYVTGGTTDSMAHVSPTIGTPTVTGGTFTSPTINTATMGTPTVTGGTFTSPTIAGNVGIGTSSPDRMLHIFGTEPVIRLEDSEAEGKYVLISANNDVGSLYLSADHGAGGTGAMIILVNGSERMRVTNDGRVGIGTSSPSYELDVYDDSAAAWARIQSGASNNAGINLTNTDREWLLYTLSGGKLYIRDVTAGANRLAIDTSGNVGIGTTSPNGMLHVKPGTGAFLVGGVDNITDTAQYIFPAGSVPQVIFLAALAGNGTDYAGGDFTMVTPSSGNVTQNLTVGSNTIQLRLFSDGSLRVVRTAGSATNIDIVVQGVVL